MTKKLKMSVSVAKDIMTQISKLEDALENVLMEKAIVQAVNTSEVESGDEDSDWSTVSDSSDSDSDSDDDANDGCGMTEKEADNMARADSQVNWTDKAYNEKERRQMNNGDTDDDCNIDDEENVNPDDIPIEDDVDLHRTSGTSDPVDLEFADNGDFLRISDGSVEVILDRGCTDSYKAKQDDNASSLELKFETILHNLHRLRVEQEELTSEIKAIQSKISSIPDKKSQDPPSNAIKTIFHENTPI